MLSIEKTGLKRFLDEHAIFAHIYSIVLIGLSWMIFAITDINSLGVYFTKLVSFGRDLNALYFIRNYGVTLVIGCLFSTPIFTSIYEKNRRKPLGIIVLVLIFVVSIAYLTDATYNPFLYFRF